jgi:hypothetical protein
MRLYGSIVTAACLTLFYSAPDCRAQAFPPPVQLEALFPCPVGAAESTRCTAPLPPPLKPQSYDERAPYYDVVVDKICDAGVDFLANTWLRGTFAARVRGTFRDRAIEVRASTVYRDQKGSSRRAYQTILATGNLIDSPSPRFCQPSVIQGIQRTEQVKVTLQLYVADEYGPKTSAAGTATAGAGAGALVGFLFGGPPGAIFVGAFGTLVGSTTEALAGGSQSSHAEFVTKHAKLFATHELLIGPTGSAQYGYTIGNEQVSFTVHQEARMEAPVYVEPDSSPGTWRPKVAPLWDAPPMRNPSPLVSALPSLQRVVANDLSAKPRTDSRLHRQFVTLPASSRVSSERLAMW